MARKQAYRPRARHGSDLVIEELPDELLVYDNARHQAHCLNRTAALVWRACDGQTSVEELTERLGQAGLPRDPALVELALEQLGRAALLEPAPGEAREDVVLRSRRKALRQLGLIAGTALALPLVQSIWAPAAAQTASQNIANPNCGARGQPCCPDRTCDSISLRCRGRCV